MQANEILPVLAKICPTQKRLGTDINSLSEF